MNGPATTRQLSYERILRLLNESQRQAQIGSWECLPGENKLWWSEEMYRIFEIEPTEFDNTYEAFTSYTHEEDRERVLGTYTSALQEDGSCELVYRIRTGKGRIKHVKRNCRVECDEQGQPVRVLGTLQDITTQVQNEHALREKEHMLSTLMSNLPGMAYRCENDEGWTMHFASDGCLSLTGYTPEEFVSNDTPTYANLIHPDDRERVHQEVQDAIREARPFALEYRIHRKDGEERWVWEQGRRITHPRHEQHYLEGFVTDITRQKQAEEHRRLSAHFFDNTSEGILVTDTNACIVEVNNAFTDMTGYTREETIGQNPRFLQSGKHTQAFYRELWETLHRTGQWQGEIWNRRKDGSIYPQLQHISAVRNEHNTLTHYVAVFSDISNLKESQRELDYLAHHDALTGLPNRLLLSERLEQAIERSQETNQLFLVIFLDLDHFKHVNDSLGHPVGDELLRKVAARLWEAVGEKNTVSRIGGDEFVILIDKIDPETSIAELPRQLLSCFARPFQLGTHEVRVTGSMGICVYPGDGEDNHTLLRNADAAMYKAKDEGRNTHQFYTKELTTKAYKRILLEHHLSQAIDKNELFLVYQPQIDLHTGRVIGAEALLRWQRGTQGLISPIDFIPLAEDSGLIHPIGKWVLETACRQGKQWMEEGIEFGRIAVNIAGPQIQRGGLPQHVKRVLEESGLPAHKLELEVTEGFIMQHASSAIEQLKEIRELGVVLAIDDFGTGYSSLSYLKTLPIHKLKIDKSFVRDIPDDSDDVAIANAIIALGKSLGLTLIAEGVETAEQAILLKESGCIEAQGYYYSRPIKVEEFPNTLHQLSQQYAH